MLIVNDASKLSETIIVDPTSSRCGNCGHYATPGEVGHFTRLPGYVGIDRINSIPTYGCGVIWRYVSSNYLGLNLKERYAMQYPHLEWNGMDESKFMKEDREYFERSEG